MPRHPGRSGISLAQRCASHRFAVLDACNKRPVRKEGARAVVPQLPLLRWVLVPWGLVFAAGTVAIAVFGDPADPGSRVVPPIFGAFMLWAAWSWWHVGAVITRGALKLRDMWGSVTIPRSALLGVRSDANQMGRLRRSEVTLQTA